MWNRSSEKSTRFSCEVAVRDQIMKTSVQNYNCMNSIDIVCTVERSRNAFLLMSTQAAI